MSNNKFCTILMAVMAMSCFSPTFSFAQTKKIQTPKTSEELVTPEKNKPAVEKMKVVEEKDEVEKDTPSENTSSAPAPRRLHQHGIGLGLGQTFLMGNYSKHGEDKITADLLYSYAASHSFDLLVDAHMSKHKDASESMRVMGLTGSIKARVVEFDNFSPYVLGGLGFYSPQADRNGTGKSTQKLTFGLNFGGGADLRLNDSYVIGLMAMLHSPFKVEQNSGSDLKGYYFKLMFTGMYLF